LVADRPTVSSLTNIATWLTDWNGPKDDLRNDFQLISLVNGLDYSVVKLLASFIAKFESIRQDATNQRKKNPEKIENKEYACFP
jgi:hypothetical protein